MSVTTTHVETVRDIAKACALFGDWRHLQNPVQHNALSSNEALAFFRADLAEIHRLQQRLSELNPNEKSEVLHLIRITNPYTTHPPQFDGRTYRTFHELAFNVLPMVAEATRGMIELLLNHRKGPRKTWFDLCHITFRTHREREEGDFHADEVAIAIEKEASAALRYLANGSEVIHTQSIDSTNPAVPTETHTSPKQELTECRLQIERWSDLGIGMDKDLTCYAFTPCPGLGDRVKIREATPLSLSGERWAAVLLFLARSIDGRTVKKDDLALAMKYVTPGEVQDQSAELDQLRSRVSVIARKLRNAMSDLGRQLKEQVHARHKSAPFESFEIDSKPAYQTPFTTRCLITDIQRHYFFGEPR